MDAYWKRGNWRNDILKEEAEKIEKLKERKEEEDFIIENVKYFFTDPKVKRKRNKSGDCVSRKNR
jgi:hypothetical protein